MVCHAAGESGAGHTFSPHTHAVILGCTRAELERLASTLQAASIQHSAIYENEGTFDGQLCAIGFPPAPKSQLRPYVKKFQLFRKEAAG